MKKALTRKNLEKFYFVDGKKIQGTPERVRGDLSGVWGDLSGVRGDLSGVWGDLSGVRGDLSGVWGDLSGVRGDLSGVWGDLSGVRGDLSGVRGDIDDCELTDEDRKNGINIENLVAEIPNDGEADLIGERYSKAPERGA